MKDYDSILKKMDKKMDAIQREAFDEAYAQGFMDGYYTHEKERKIIENKMKVGDEVYSSNDPKTKGVVTNISKDLVVVMTQNGKWWTPDKSTLWRTGRYFAEIDKVLSSLQKGE